MNETNIKHGYSLMVHEARGAILNPGALKTKLSDFQGQNFKDRGTLGAELVCFYIQGQPADEKKSKMDMFF